jgi:hypothetical protein
MNATVGWGVINIGGVGDRSDGADDGVDQVRVTGFKGAQQIAIAGPGDVTDAAVDDALAASRACG